MVPEDLDRLETILIDALRLGVKLAPPPYNALLPLALPLLESFVRHQMIAPVKTGLADGTMITLSDGTIVTKEWADDPRHQLNQDGTFKF